METQEKESLRIRRHRRVRRRLFGVPERPRLVVHRSHLHLYAQLIDDTQGKVLLSLSTLQPDFRKGCPKGGNVEAAKRLGELVASKAKAAGVTKVVFDRGGYLYHGRIKALAEAARQNSLEI